MAGFCRHPAVQRLDDSFNRKILKPHFFLQFLVDPEAGEDDQTIHTAQLDFPVIPFDPRLGHVELWNVRSPDIPLLRI